MVTRAGVVLLLMLVVSMMPPSGATTNMAGAQPMWGSTTAIFSSLRGFSMALQSLFQNVASLRSERGDLSGADRARAMAATLGSGLQWWMGVGSLSWDYLAHYYFTQSVSRGAGLSQALLHLSDLSAIVAEVVRLNSEGEQLQWIADNYSRVLSVTKTLLHNLLSVFDQSGALRNCVMAIRREVLEGDLFCDLLQLRPTNVQSLVRMSMEVLEGFFAPTPSGGRGSEL